MRTSLSAAIIVFGLMRVFSTLAWSGPAGEEVRLIVRGDDMGMTEGSLVAFLKTL